jgi:mono/diheme cytochrome c family protein
MRSTRIISLLIGAGIAAAAAGGSLIQRTPATAAARLNPVAGNSQAISAGAKLYERECSACHGAAREGRSKAPALDQPEVRGAAAGTLFWVLRNGDLRRGMPSFAHLPEAERWQIITFLQSGAGQ